MVRKHGVPGPGAHRYPYVNLKERQLDRLIRDHKARWNDRILLLTGARRNESQRRMGQAVEVKRDGCTVWCNPLIDWTDGDMRAYRMRHQLEQSDVAALLHRSGECNCGAFAGPGERAMLEALFPAWFERVIGGAEEAARSCGKWPSWGERPPRSRVSAAGPLCSGCASTQMGLFPDAP
jgi:phosphoadenosine phosphosulfate reductase